MRIPRLVVVGLVVSILAGTLALGPRVARAATISVGTVVMTLEKINPDGTFVLMNQMDATDFFNQANCLCHAPFAVKLTLVGATGVISSNVQLQIWLGTGCSDNTNIEQRNQTCSQFGSAIPLESFRLRSMDLPIDVEKVMFPKSDECDAATGSSTVWGLIDTDNDKMWDQGGIFQLSDGAGTATSIAYDTQPPDAVTNTAATGVEDGFSVSWNTSVSDVTSLRGYQVLCQWETTGGPIFMSPPAAQYRRTSEERNSTNTGTCTVPPNPTGTIGGGNPDAGTEDIDAGSADLDAGTAVADAATAAVDAATADEDAGTGEADAGTRVEDPAFTNLDPKYLCTDIIGGTSESVRIDISDESNLTPHAEDEGIIAKVVAIDLPRNYSVADVGRSGSPKPVRDAWEYYHDLHGNADGGYCFVATAAYGNYDHPYVKVLRRFRDETLATFGWGRDFIAWYYATSPPWADFLRAHPVARVTAAVLLFPVVALAAVWNELGVVGFVVLGLAFWALRRWRRRRVGVALAATVTALLLFVGGPARAQSWLDEDEMSRERPGPSLPNWAIEIKLGPYYPDIDGEPGLTGKPYEGMFGSGSSLLIQGELDYFFLHPLGELGIGVSGGYMSNSAKSFLQVSDSDTSAMSCNTAGTPPCRGSDDTTIKIFPLALLAVYRFTALSDNLHVPLVPYAKLGLSYYIWRITKGNGDLSTFNGQSGAGATLGWQGSIGLSIRAEQLDPDAARSMQSDLGVDHIGFFFEGTFADVSGLGQSNKLHLGDLTWAGGLNFEF